MSAPRSDESWKTPAMALAEQELDAAIESSQQQLAEAQQLRQQLEAKPPVSDKDAAWLKKVATAPDAPDEWRKVANRVDNGTLTYRDIAEGRASTDPTVAAAMAVKPPMDNLPPLDQLQAKIDAQLANMAGTGSADDATAAPGGQPPGGQPRHARPDELDDDDFSAGGILA